MPHQALRYEPAASPLPKGSYRALAATANNFARESHMDEMAAATGADPVQFRLRHLDDSRLAEVLTRAFGVPAVLADVLRGVDGITAAYIYGSWAARHEGQTGLRPVGDIDVLVLGEPDRDQLYAALSAAEQRLGRPVQATIRDRLWLEAGSGAFHDTVTSRPLLRLPPPGD